MRLNMTSVASALVVGTLMATGTALMYYIGSLQVMNPAANFTLGDLLVFSAYLLMLYQPLEQLTYTAWALEGAAAGAQRCFEVLDSQDDVPEARDADGDALPFGTAPVLWGGGVAGSSLGGAQKRPTSCSTATSSALGWWGSTPRR